MGGMAAWISGYPLAAWTNRQSECRYRRSWSNSLRSSDRSVAQLGGDPMRRHFEGDNSRPALLAVADIVVDQMMASYLIAKGLSTRSAPHHRIHSRRCGR